MATYSGAWHPPELSEFLIAARDANRLVSVAIEDMEKRVMDSRQVLGESRELIAKADSIIEVERNMWSGQ
jgi:hypothetical protein